MSNIYENNNPDNLIKTNNNGHFSTNSLRDYRPETDIDEEQLLGELNTSNTFYGNREYGKSINTKLHKPAPYYDVREKHYSQFCQTLLYNIILSFTSLCVGGLTMIVWPLNSHKYWMIPFIDYLVSSLTAFIMLGRNRAFVFGIYQKYIVRCCKMVMCRWCCKCFLYSSYEHDKTERLLNNNMKDEY